MKSLDFTLDKYKDLCNALIDSGYTTVPFRDYLVMEPSEERIAIMRHDVDRKIGNALRMAALERSIGIRSTYYFRDPYTFNPEIIKKIQTMGHEIDYNYEMLSKRNGDV